MTGKDLPVGSNPKPLEFSHFPTRQPAVIWRNLELAPVETLARVLKTDEKRILDLSAGMGRQSLT